MRHFPFLAFGPEKLQAARLLSSVPKSAEADLGPLGVSGSTVLRVKGSLDETGLSCDYFWVLRHLLDNSQLRSPALLPSLATWPLAVGDREGIGSVDFER